MNFKLDADTDEHEIEQRRARLTGIYEHYQKTAVTNRTAHDETESEENEEADILALDAQETKSARSALKAGFELLPSDVLEEVKFEQDAPLDECFPSALKCWRIHKPNVIQLVGCNIKDAQVVELAQFLRGRNMI